MILSNPTVCLHPFSLISRQQSKRLPRDGISLRWNFQIVKGLLLTLLVLYLVPPTLGAKIASNQIKRALRRDFSRSLTSEDTIVPQEDENWHERFLVGPPYSFQDAQVNLYTDADQSSSSVAVLQDGTYIVTWESWDQDGSGWGIYARRYSNKTNAYNQEFRVNTHTTDDQMEPSIAALSDGGFIITWTSSLQDSSDNGVYAQRYYADATKYGSEFQVNQHVADSQEYSRALGLADGGYLLVWTSWNQDGSDRGVYAQIYNNDGSIRKSEFQVNSHTGDDQSQAFPIKFQDGRFLIIWNSDNQIGSGYECYGKIYASDGTEITSEFIINTNTTDDQTIPKAAALADGGFIATWVSQGQDGDGKGIYAQRFDTNGGKVGPEFQVNIHTTDDQEGPALASLGNQGFVIVWQSKDQEGNDWEVYMQKYDSNGIPLYNTDIRVNSIIYGDQSQVTLDVFSNDNILFTWHSGGTDGNGFGIFMRIIDSNGDSIPSADISCSPLNNFCNFPSTKIYNTLIQGTYNLATQSIYNPATQGIYDLRTQDHTPLVGSLDQKGLVISFSLGRAIESNENVVNSLGNGLEASLFDIIVFGISCVLLCLYILSRRRHLDSAGKCYDKQTGIFTNTLENFSRELSGVVKVYWLIRPLYVYIQANHLLTNVNYNVLCDHYSQQALFVLFFFIAKTFKPRHLRRFMELMTSSQKSVLANWRVFLQDVLIIILVSSIQVLLPSNMQNTSFLGKLTGNVVYYVFEYLWADQAIEWMRNKVCVDFLPLFSNTNLTHYIRNCRYYNKAELYLLTTQELCKKIISDIRDKFNTTELMLIECTNPKSSTQYLLVRKKRTTKSLKFSVNFQVERSQYKPELKNTTSLAICDTKSNDSGILSVCTPESKMLIGLQQRCSMKQRTVKIYCSDRDLCFFIPMISKDTFSESDIALIDMKSGQEMTWKFEHSSPCSLVYSQEKSTLLLVTPKSSSENLIVSVYEQKNKHKRRKENIIFSQSVHLWPNNLSENASIVSLKDQIWHEAQRTERQIRRITHQKTSIKLDMSFAVDIDGHLYKKAS